MKKKELLKMIEELQTQVTGLKAEVAILKAQMWHKQDRDVFIPSVFGPVDVCTDGGYHDYPSPWAGTVPPSCKKCGKMAASWAVTSVTTSTDHLDAVGCKQCAEDRVKTGFTSLPDELVRELERKL